MALNRHFRDFIALLEGHRVEFLAVDGYAVGFHGFPRHTGDLDVFVANSDRNATELISVFSEFGFPEIDLTKSDSLERDVIVEIGREPMKIQVLTGIDGVAFDACFQGRVVFVDGQGAIPFISLEDLIANKDAAPRPKDKIDAVELRRIRDENKQ